MDDFLSPMIITSTRRDETRDEERGEKGEGRREREETQMDHLE
jgi:hypothetical protein